MTDFNLFFPLTHLTDATRDCSVDTGKYTTDQLHLILTMSLNNIRKLEEKRHTKNNTKEKYHLKVCQSGKELTFAIV